MTTTTIHRLVAKAAKEWTDLAERYGVGAAVEPYESKYRSGGAIVTFDTGICKAFEHASVLIFPPLTKGATVRQAVLYSRYYRGRGGKMKYGTKPGTTLRDLRNQIIWSWSPTARERLEASMRPRAERVSA